MKKVILAVMFSTVLATSVFAQSYAPASLSFRIGTLKQEARYKFIKNFDAAFGINNRVGDVYSICKTYETATKITLSVTVEREENGNWVVFKKYTHTEYDATVCKLSETPALTQGYDYRLTSNVTVEINGKTEKDTVTTASSVCYSEED